MAMSNSRARMALAAMCVVLAALRFEALAWMLPLLGLVAAVGGTREFARLAKNKGIEMSSPVAYAAAVGLYLAGLSPTDVFPWLVVSLLAALVVVGFVGHLALRSYEGSVVGVGLALFPALYLGLSLACGLQVLRVDRMAFVFVLGCVWAMDSAAYYYGCAYGRHKLAPRISPKKSWEGAAAGFVGSLAAAGLAAWLLPLPMGWPEALALGALFGVIGQVGDLAESALKRDAGVKDSGTSFAGHGGVLDRLDSLLFCFLGFYIYLLSSGAVAMEWSLGVTTCR